MLPKLGLFVACAATAVFAQTPVLNTQNGDLQIRVADGKEVVLNQAGGASVSLFGGLSAMESNIAENAAELSMAATARMEMESDIRSSLADAVNTTASQLVALGTHVDIEVGRIEDHIRNVSAEAENDRALLRSDTLASIASLAVAARDDARTLSQLRSALAPATPTVNAADVVTGEQYIGIKLGKVDNPVVSDFQIEARFKLAALASDDDAPWNTTRKSVSSKGLLQFKVDNGGRGLRPSTSYALQIRVGNNVGYGAWSNVFIANTTDSTNGADVFKCAITRDITCGSNTVCTACTISLQLYSASYAYVAMSGHYKTGRSNVQASVGVSIDGDNENPGAGRSAQIKGNSIGYSTNYEAIHVSRTSGLLSAGNHTVELLFKCNSGASCDLKGWGLQGMVVKAVSGVSTASCRGSGYEISVSNRVQVCQLTYTARVPSIVAMTFNGAIRSGHIYGVGSLNNDGMNAWSRQDRLPAHSYSGNYENFGSHRAGYMSTGRKTTNGIFGSGSGRFREGSVHQIVFPAYPQIPTNPTNSRSQTFKCWSGWGRGAHNPTRPDQICQVTINLPVEALVMAEYTGHYHSQGRGCMGMIMFDNDENGWFSQPNLLSNTEDWGDRMLSFGYTGQWENFRSKRFKILPAGTHTVQLKWKPVQNTWCGFNGQGMDGFWIPASKMGFDLA